MVGSEISVVIPVYFPTLRTKEMSDNNILYAKSTAPSNIEWIIVETESQYYRNDADIYIHESNKTDPNKSVNRGFRSASGKYVIFLANDVKVCDNWVEKMLECFKKHPNCGLSSLGNNEHNDPTDDVIIEEGQNFFFSVSMMRKSDAWLDPQYTYIFDDTDLIFRLHLSGKKFYKNLSGYVEHKKHSTYGKFCGNLDEYRRGREIFKRKYKKYSSDPLYQRFIGHAI